MWDICPVNDPLNPFAIHIVLIDAEGNKIEAIARKEFISKFRSELREGNVYMISNFIVVSNSGNYMATGHECKLVFNEKTQSILEETPSIPLNAFSFKNFEEILATGGESDYLIVDADRMPVVIIQFAKIKTFKGSVVVQNVKNATVLLWNPPIQEAVSFYDGLALHGIEADMSLAEVDDDDDDLHDGVFVVLTKISGLLEGEKWWYSACTCHRAVKVEDGLFYCNGCGKHALSVNPRFRLKVEVDDGGESGVFVIFDTDCQQLLNRTCKELVKKNCADPAVAETFKDKSKMVTKDKFSKIPEGSNESIGDYSANLSEIAPNVLSLDEISPVDGSGVCSSVQSVASDGSFQKPATKMKLRSVKLEKE
ncbi:uncharacterized protein LOC130725386 [Lotus japonicus]|uniref:uncharacterized protein LOC130725386 n=1 Tax=Lotus japonicus TaxID=34305 RepID=UPI00259071EA|nr:uncharacterized protein LOC130725386 [Lotus japonicus]